MSNEGYGTWSVQVRLSVCLSVSSYSCITGYEAAHEQYQRLQNYEYLKNKGDFPDTTAFERYAINRSKKANMDNHTSLPRLIRLLFVPSRGTISHHEGRVSTPA